MRTGSIPENPIERILLAAGALPTPLLDTMGGMLLSRTILVASKLGVFQTLAPGPLNSTEVADRIHTNPHATEKLLNGLVGCKYLRHDGQRYSLARVARKWLLEESPRSLHDNMLFRLQMEWNLVEQYEEFVRTGKPLDLHSSGMGDEEWGLYQRAMRSIASLASDEIARRAPVPKEATAMLDIGGSHGYFSVALCRRHPGLSSTILDLPDAIKHAAPILAKENMGDRVVHKPGNALTDDLGENVWDVVFISHLLHHFDDPTNRELSKRVARALKPGGVFTIQEILRPRSPGEAGQMGALMDLFFALTSESGTWSIEDMTDWQRQAGLTPRKPVRLMTVPGGGLISAVKS